MGAALSRRETVEKSERVRAIRECIQLLNRASDKKYRMAHISIGFHAGAMTSRTARPDPSMKPDACGRASPAPDQTPIAVRHPGLPVRSARLRPPAPPAGASAGVRQPLSRFLLLAGARVRAWRVPFCALSVKGLRPARAGALNERVLDGQSTKQRRLAIACMAGPAIQAVMSKTAIADCTNGGWPESETPCSDSSFGGMR